MASGVKQSDPSSMVLFLLAYESTQQWISILLPPMELHFLGMGDNPLVATSNIWQAWATLIKVSPLITKFSTLRISAAKTPFPFACHDEFGDETRSLLRLHPGSKEASTWDFLKYLGIMLGPGANVRQWKLAISGITEVLNFITKHTGGLITKTDLYNPLAHSSFIAYFVPPTSVLIELETEGHQNGSWNQTAWLCLKF